MLLLLLFKNPFNDSNVAYARKDGRAVLADMEFLRKALKYSIKFKNII
jgi:hypothetical protein